MTLEANLQTQHAVPECEECNSMTGSIVFRTITTKFSAEEVRKEIKKRENKRKREETA
tara:strand:- start:269 stop:442 length:174 start_codon:yes stop_codon:yes gene_type:complete